MKTKQAKITVSASQLPGILIEKYTYSAGGIEPLPKHSHQEYQLGISFDCQGEYFYRGAYHPIPIGNLSIIHSGEVHSPSDRTYLPQPATFWMMHVDPSWLEETASAIADKVNIPFFTEPILRDRSLARLFYSLCLAIQTSLSKLSTDSLALDFFTRLITQNKELTVKSDRADKPAIALRKRLIPTRI